MKAFPGSISWAEFTTMPLEAFAQTYALAVEFIEAEAEAIRKANKG